MMGTTVVCTNTQKRWSTSKENKTTKGPRPDGRGPGWLGYKDSNLNCLIQSQMYYRYTIPHRGQVVPMKRFELLRGHPHYALNVARLPVPPHRRSHLFLSYCTRNARGLSNPNHVRSAECDHRERFGDVRIIDPVRIQAPAGILWECCAVYLQRFETRKIAT